MSTYYPVANYPLNSSYKIAKVSGTSQASPGVAGLICGLMQSRPWYDVTRIQQFFTNHAIDNRLQDSGSSTSYDDFQSLLGGPNKYIYNPWHGQLPTEITELSATIHGKL
jgi:hypothetical protein